MSARWPQIPAIVTDTLDRVLPPTGHFPVFAPIVTALGPTISLQAWIDYAQIFTAVLCDHRLDLERNLAFRDRPTIQS